MIHASPFEIRSERREDSGRLILTGELDIATVPRVEEAARAIRGVTNSEGAEAGWSRSRVAMAASNGFAGAYEGSRHGVSVCDAEGRELLWIDDLDALPADLRKILEDEFP